MSASYNPALPTARDRLRFLLGDTRTDAPLLPDSTYNAILASVNNDERRALLALADGLIARYALEPNRVSVEGVKAEEWSERLTAWRALSDRLRAEINREQALSGGARSGFGVATARRAGDAEPGCEYYAGERAPL